MNTHTRAILRLAGLALSALALQPFMLHTAAAQSGKPLVLRVAYPPGGPADVAARKLQAPLQALVGQSVIVDNSPGAGGSIGATTVQNAPADGQTLLVTTGNDLILAPLAIAQVKYKPESFRLLTPIFPTDFALVTSAQHNFASVDDLVDQARKKRDKEFTAGSWGYGSAPFLVTADFSAATGAKLTDIPYKGAAPVMQALLSQEIDMAFVPLAASVLEHIRAGKLKPIGVASSKRNPFLPNVPTLNESRHLKNFVYTAWAAVFVSTAVPEATAARLNKDLVEVVRREEFARFLHESAGLPVEPMTLSQAADFYKAEMEKFRRIARAVKLEPQ